MSKDSILIRCISTNTEKTKNMYPAIANNKQLMRSMGWTISDPNYDAKMEAVKSGKPFSENGKTPEPKKEAFIKPSEAPVKEEQAKPKAKVAVKPKAEAKKKEQTKNVPTA